MKNQQIAQLARDKGFSAEIERTYSLNTQESDCRDYTVSDRVNIGLFSRKVSIMEVSQALDLPAELFFSHPRGVTIYGTDA